METGALSAGWAEKIYRVKGRVIFWKIQVIFSLFFCLDTKEAIPTNVGTRTNDVQPPAKSGTSRSSAALIRWLLFFLKSLSNC
jgi:hypothetical protein